jgi:hypothetical protein
MHWDQRRDAVRSRRCPHRSIALHLGRVDFPGRSRQAAPRRVAAPEALQAGALEVRPGAMRAAVLEAWPAGEAAWPADAAAPAALAAAAQANGAARSRGGRKWRQTQNPRSSLNPPHFSKHAARTRPSLEGAWPDHRRAGRQKGVQRDTPQPIARPHGPRRRSILLGCRVCAAPENRARRFPRAPHNRWSTEQAVRDAGA